MSWVESDQLGAGPIVPSPHSVAVLRPLPFRLDDGFWATRQQVNGATSIPHGLRQLRVHGQWDDLRRAGNPAVTGQRTEATQHAGRPYGDSDIYKMAEAVAWHAQHTSDETTGRDAAVAVLAEIGALVCDAQEDSGYVNSWFQSTGTPRFSDLPMGHELYCAGHLIQAAVAAARTGAGTALVAAARRFADHLGDTFGAEDHTGLCGHAEIETALVELYRLTGHRPYLTLARRLIDRRGHGHLGPGHHGAAYYQDDVPIRAARELDGHCVRALYLAAGATDVYLETGDATLLPALTGLWRDTVASKTYLTGGVGCRRKTEAFGAAYELPPDQAFNETCAAVANLMWSWRLLLATGEGCYADHIERILFNVLAAGVSLPGERFSYINTLHRRAAAMEHGDKAPYRKSWFGCACCPPNLMRTLASIDHYLATGDGEGVQIHQYASGTVRCGGLELAVRTGYPWSGRVTLDVTAAGSGERTVRLRVPAWCRESTVEINGTAVEGTRESGYLVLGRCWRPGDQIVLELAMPPRFSWPHPRIDAVRGCVAIERGPLVYCVEDADLVAGQRLDDLWLDTGQPLRTVARPDLLGGIVAVQAVARQRAEPAAGWPYGEEDAVPDDGSSVAVTAIPYYAWDNRDRGMMRVWLPSGG